MHILPFTDPITCCQIPFTFLHSVQTHRSYLQLPRDSLSFTPHYRQSENPIFNRYISPSLRNRDLQLEIPIAKSLKYRQPFVGSFQHHSTLTRVFVPTNPVTPSVQQINLIHFIGIVRNYVFVMLRYMKFGILFEMFTLLLI